MDWKERYNYWIKNAPKQVQLEISTFTDDEKKLFFEKDIEFGTAGLRGKIGYSTSGINEFIIAKYSLAFAKLILSKYGEQAKKEGIVIAHDNRRKNILFSETAANVFSAMDIPVFFFKNNELQPTPLLSYVIAQGEYVGGINITASHNPPEYNGYKVYGHSGAQLLPEDTDKIVDFAQEDVNIFKIKQDSKLVSELSPSIVNKYIDTVLRLIPFNDEKRSDIKVVYTPQHGTATKIADKILSKLNVNYEMVKEQSNPDPEFSNTDSPNPQNPNSFILAREYGDRIDADVLFSTDPDADRFGIEVKHNGEWIHIDGNHLPLIQLEYKLMNLKKLNYLSKGDFIVRSVVTSNAADRIAEKYGIDVHKNLTGFKWLMHEAHKYEMMGNECLFAWEESYGSTIRTFTKDKDSFQALTQVVEIVKYYKDRGMTLIDALNEIQSEIGFFQSPQDMIKIDGIGAMDKMLKIIEKFKSLKVGDKFGDMVITKIADFSKGYKSYEKDEIVLIRFNNQHSINIRPSGTEPILRIYYNAYGTSRDASKKTFKKLKDIVLEIKG